MKAHTVIKAAINSARTQPTKNRLEEIGWCPDYAEPGYTLTAPDKKAGIYFGDWNEPTVYDSSLRMRVKVTDGNILPRLARALERCGADIEWSDEWTTCDDCGKALRTQPDSYFWEPAGIVDLVRGSCLCRTCNQER